tara:strand:- start:881 stop:994 length:114 start_codon:yes stop_codon:yes gene_type:complete
MNIPLTKTLAASSFHFTYRENAEIRGGADGGLETRAI